MLDHHLVFFIDLPKAMSLLESSTLSEKLTPEEVAEIFKRDKEWAIELMRQEDFGMKFGGVWRADPDKLEQWIKERKPPGDS